MVYKISVRMAGWKVALVFFVASAEKAKIFRDALLAENIRTPSGSYPGVMYDESKADGHVFVQWAHIIPNVEKIARKEYSRSLELLSRAVHIDISPLDTEEETHDIIGAVHKVASVIL